ncbi:MAG TPA: neutral zinc metallopeptidase [Solirubrobacteraceae bacterium]|nr:neutral zinc metallopeptidase [Solirubrobacteraceae bacterium]
MRRPLSLLLLLLAVLVPPAGCGAEDEVRERAEEVREDVERGIERAQKEFEERRERYGRRFREVMEDLEKVFERPEETSPVVRSRGRNQPQTIDAFLTGVLEDVDRYWSRTFATADLPEPVVRYAWVPPGSSLLTGCGQRADDRAAFYCPADDTIYVAQRFAAALYQGMVEGLPGQTAGYGRAAGDFAVAYVVAHEYGHNLQQELGIFDNRVAESARPFELQADCMAGSWAHSVFAAGALQPGDLEEATNAALAVGDFDYGNAQHHGTPTERRDALLAGFDSGDPSVCSRFVAPV